jgi:hypothetical protein
MSLTPSVVVPIGYRQRRPLRRIAWVDGFRGYPWHLGRGMPTSF